jgi:hypothetical protein
MSKIVILSVQLGTSQILNNLLEEIAGQNPNLAEWLKQLDPLPIIKECVVNAIDRLGQMPGISKEANISDYFGNIDYAYNSQLIGALKTDKLPHGLGFKVNDQGAVEFVADEYTTEWRQEIKRLRELFTDAFLAEATNSILTILGYEVVVSSSLANNGGLFFHLEGVKQ